MAARAATAQAPAMETARSAGKKTRPARVGLQIPGHPPWRPAAGGKQVAPLPRVRSSLLLLAAALAGSLAAPTVCHADTSPAATAAKSSAAPMMRGLGRGPGGKGLSLRQPLTTQTALAISASNGTRRELPEVRVLLGIQYLF